MQCRAAIGGCLEGEIRICSQKLLAMFVPIQVAAREDVDLGSRSEESLHCFIISIPGRCVERRSPSSSFWLTESDSSSIARRSAV